MGFSISLRTLAALAPLPLFISGCVVSCNDGNDDFGCDDSCYEGGYALASLWEDEGAVIVLDAQTLEEVKRLPMRKPVGKYNVWNKITREEGTSH